MRKKILLLTLFTFSVSVFSETLYVLIKGDGSTITGYIIEDNPQESVIMEDLEGELHVVIYTNVISISPVNRSESTHEMVDDEQIADVDVVESPLEEVDLLPELDITVEVEPILPKLKIEPVLPVLDKDLIITQMTDLSLLDLTRLELDEELLNDSSRGDRYEIYNSLKKDDTLKYTLWNIIPGAGSIMQGDYSSAIYTLSSVLTTVAYNLIAAGTVNDFFFIINLNGALAYVSSFLAPLRYNNKYNTTIKDKLTL